MTDHYGLQRLFDREDICAERRHLYFEWDRCKDPNYDRGHTCEWWLMIDGQQVESDDDDGPDLVESDDDLPDLVESDDDMPGLMWDDGHISYTSYEPESEDFQ
jgi:hypothetical protein